MAAERSKFFAEQGLVPVVHDASPAGLVAAEAYSEHNLPGHDLNARSTFLFFHHQKISPSPQVMTFPGDEIKLALSGLRLKFRLYGLYPAEPCKGKYPDDFAASVGGRGNAHIAVRGIDGHVHVLDVLAPDGNVQSAGSNK